MLKFLNRISIGKKMLLIFLFSVLIPFAIQYYLFYNRIQNDLEEEIEGRLQTTLENRSQVLEGYFAGLLSLSRKYHQNYEINQNLNTVYTSEKDYFSKYYEIKEAVVSDVPYHLQIQSIAFITNNPTVFNGGYVARRDDAGIISEDESFLGQYDITEGNVSYIITTQGGATANNGLKHLSMIKKLDYFSQFSDYQNNLKIDVNLIFMSSLLKEIGLFDQLYVLDQQDRVLISSDGVNEDRGFRRLNRLAFSEEQVLYTKTLEGVPFYLVGVYSKSTILNQFLEFRWLNLMTSVASVAFAACFMFVIAGNIQRRMNKVVQLSEHIAEGNFIQLEELEHGEDEFSELEKSMNVMSERLIELVDYEYKSKLAQMALEKETVKAKLFALQSQVNPHFLFNALESIRLKALANDEYETGTMLKYMAKMFRRIINWNEDIILLKEEVDFLMEFLSIQKYRFEDEFSFIVDVPKQLMGCEIPKMIIQPLVENACIHGTSGDRVLHVQIKVTDREEMLHICVRDNGNGISEIKLAEIRTALQNESYTSNVGLYNVFQRLNLFYKDQYSFDIRSSPGEGTVCEVSIPKKFEAW